MANNTIKIEWTEQAQIVRWWFVNATGLNALIKRYIAKAMACCPEKFSKAEKLDDAARMIWDDFKGMSIYETPDGCPYSLEGIRAAIDSPEVF